MLRLLAPALLLYLSVLAQAQCPPNCPKVDLAPISGRVLNAADSSPIAGAVVHYRGTGGTTDAQHHELNPTTLQGQVTAAPDGSYTLPNLPPGLYVVRAAAPGFLGVRKNLQPLPVNFNPGPPTPVPQSICMQMTGKPSCGNLPGMPDAVFHLVRDSLHLQTMSAAALPAFALPQRSNPSREFLAGAFTPDGNRFGFLTSDRITLGDVSKAPVEAPFERCAAWAYDLSSGILIPVQEGILEPLCQNPVGMVWEADFLYIYLQKQPGAATADIAERVEGSSAMPWLSTNMPHAVQDKQAHQAANAAADQAAFNKTQTASQITDDRQFTVEDHLGGGRGSCETLEFIAVQAPRPTVLTQECAGLTYLLDGGRDLLFYIEQPRQIIAQSTPFGKLIEYDLKTGSRRSFDLPIAAQGHGPQLLAQQSLPNGATRIAYSTNGDCDPAASDYTQPFAPANQLGTTPNLFSVCFVTIPPAPAAPRH